MLDSSNPMVIRRRRRARSYDDLVGVSPSKIRALDIPDDLLGVSPSKIKALDIPPSKIRALDIPGDLLGVSSSKVRALDIRVPVTQTNNSIETYGVWSHRAFSDETAFRHKPPPLYENGAQLEELMPGYAGRHLIRVRNPMETMPLKVIPLPQYRTLEVSEFSPFAERALAYFNCDKNVDFKLVQVTRVGYNIIPNPTVHINFDAISNSGNPQMFYAELKTRSFSNIDEKGIEIKGCAMLEKVDIANPLGISCSICKNKVIHPGPRDGYDVRVGDKFEGSSFWLYRPCVGLDCPAIKRSTIRYMDKYIHFAKKAVKHLNCKVEGDWELLVVTRVANRLEKRRKRFHMNFTVKSSNLKNETKLCFAELFLPLFSGHSPDNWTMEKEPFLEVSGCCIMEEDAINESLLGRVCDLCTGGLIHPGPRYGYRVLAGDDFAMYDFKTCGNGNGVFSE